MSRKYPDGIPPATPAAGDLSCWLHAAYPAREDGWLPTARIAEDLDVSASTVRRWAKDSTKTPRQDHRTYLARRAVLRGRGTYLWPQLDQASLFRQRAQGEHHARCSDLVDAGTPLPEWRGLGHLEPYWVVLAWYPAAHTYQVAMGRTKKGLTRIEYRAEILQRSSAPSMFHAAEIKSRSLARNLQRQCIAPRELVPTGRTDVLLELPGQDVPRLSRRARR